MGLGEGNNAGSHPATATDPNVTDRAAKGLEYGSYMSLDPGLGWLTNRLFGGGDVKATYDSQVNAGPAYSAAQGSGQGLQQGDGSAYGWADKTGQGTGEQFIGQNVNQMSGPAATAGFNQQAQQFMRGPTASGQVAQGLNADPNFNAYYDRARERQAGSANDQMAARGGYGSSAGMDMMMQGQSDLNAQQANREADYMQAHQGQRIEAAGNADTARQGLYGLGADAASAADSAGIGRFSAGSNAALSAQQARENRINTLFQQQQGQELNINNSAQPWLLAQPGVDLSLLETAGGYENGIASEIGRAEAADYARTVNNANIGVGAVGAAGYAASTAYGGGFIG